MTNAVGKTTRRLVGLSPSQFLSGKSSAKTSFSFSPKLLVQDNASSPSRISRPFSPCRDRMLGGIGCLESLIPWHNVTSEARLVSRISTNMTALYEVNLEQRRDFASEQSKEAISDTQKEEKEMITVTFVDKEGDEKTVKVPIGMSMLEAAHQNDVELEGACEGSLACSTCHVIVMDDEYYEKLAEPTDEENDMLDLAFGLTETSRLGCQVIAKPELDGMRLALPAATRNFAVDGHVPKPH